MNPEPESGPFRKHYSLWPQDEWCLLEPFRKHYFFWVDDEWVKAPESLLHAFEVSHLFDLSFARGLYSALQVLNAIKKQEFPKFDLAFLDVCLDKSDRYFAKVDTLAATSPFGDETDIGTSSIYIDDKAELNKIEEFSPPEEFGFNLELVKQEVDQSGGLFVWSWAFRICGDAKYIIYSASDVVRSRLEFLRIAGILELCNKLELFHRRDPKEYLNEATASNTAKYQQLTQDNFSGINKITYIPFVSNRRIGEDLFDNCIVEKKQDFLSLAYFTSAQRRKDRSKALIIHEMSVNEAAGEVRVTYQRYSEFLEWMRVSPPKPYIIEKLIAVIDQKIERNEIDRVLARTILNAKDPHQLWSVNIAGREPSERPTYLLPLGGEVDLANRTIRFSSDEKAKSEYIFASFFLPWAGALLGGDAAKIKTALDDIKLHFGDKLKNGCGLMRRFCGSAPFNDFIESAALTRGTDQARLALECYNEQKIKAVLLDSTANLIENYLRGEPPYSEWQSMKDRVELSFRSLMSHLEKWKASQDTAWNIDINSALEDLDDKCYADTSWVISVLETIQSNLTLDKAFDSSKGFDKTPHIKLHLSMESEPGRISITIEDNGVGFDVNALGAQNSGYSRLLQGKSGRLLQSYGKLKIRSLTGERDLETGQISENVTRNGTLVIFSILLG